MQTFDVDDLQDYGYVLYCAEDENPVFLRDKERISHVIITKDDFNELLSEHRQIAIIKKMIF